MSARLLGTKTFADLPDVMSPSDLAAFLPIGRNGVYEALQRTLSITMKARASSRKSQALKRPHTGSCRVECLAVPARRRRSLATIK